MAGETTNTDSFDRTKLDGDGMGGDAYYAERQNMLDAGEPTWVRRSFASEPDTPAEYDFYVNGQWEGSVSHIGWPYMENYTYSASKGTTQNLGSLREAVIFLESSLN